MRAKWLMGLLALVVLSIGACARQPSTSAPQDGRRDGGVAPDVPGLSVAEEEVDLGSGTGAGPLAILGPPDGVRPLATDMFTSTDFYRDGQQWLDPRYYRCNTPRELYSLWIRGTIGQNPPRSATWADCGDRYPERGSEWIWGASQAPTVLSVLTPTYHPPRREASS